MHARFQIGYQLIVPNGYDGVQRCMLESDDNGNNFVKWFGMVPNCEGLLLQSLVKRIFTFV